MKKAWRKKTKDRQQQESKSPLPPSRQRGGGSGNIHTENFRQKNEGFSIGNDDDPTERNREKGEGEREGDDAKRNKYEAKPKEPPRMSPTSILAEDVAEGTSLFWVQVSDKKNAGSSMRRVGFRSWKNGESGAGIGRGIERTQRKETSGKARQCRAGRGRVACV